MTLLASSLCCIGGIWGLSSQKTARVGKSLVSAFHLSLKNGYSMWLRLPFRPCRAVNAGLDAVMLASRMRCDGLCLTCPPLIDQFTHSPWMHRA